MSSTQDLTAALKQKLGVPATPEPSTTGSKKKKKNSSTKRGKQQQNNSSQSNNSNPKNNNNKGNNSSHKKKKGKANSGGKDNSGNFALSEFQNIPDASELPIPVFTSPTEQKPIVETSQLSALLNGVNLETGTSSNSAPKVNPPLPSNLPTAEELEQAAIAEAASKRVEESSSETGVDLMKLAKSPPQQKSSNMMASPPRTSMQNPMSSPPPPMPPSGYPPMMQPPMPPMPPPPQHQQQYPPPPAGYITVQVQVPPQLLPNRMMAVHSPAGYPVQIQIPPNVPPGALIPVHVPAAPAPAYAAAANSMSPYGSPGYR